MRFAVAHPADDRLLGTMPLALRPLVRAPVEAVVVGGVPVPARAGPVAAAAARREAARAGYGFMRFQKL